MLKILLSQWMTSIYVGFISFVLSVFIARELGPIAFGNYAVALAAGGIISIFMDGGMRNLLLREGVLSSRHLVNFSKRLLAIALGYSMTTTIILVFIVFLLAPRSSLGLSLSTLACFFMLVTSQYISSVLKGRGDFVLEAKWQVFNRSLSALVILVVVLVGFKDACSILVAWAISTIAGNLIFHHGLKFRPKFEFQPLLYKVMYPLIVIDLATAVYFRGDMLILRWLGVPQAWTGQYAAAYRIIEGAILLASPLGILAFRRLRQQHENLLILRHLFFYAVLVAFFSGLAGALLISNYSSLIIRLSYGANYTDASYLLETLAWALVFLLPNILLTQAALAFDLGRAYALIASIAAFSSTVFNFKLIPLMGPIVVVWISLVTELILFVGLSLVMVMHFNKHNNKTTLFFGK
jgi:O-antigen/teichoic acid export membrane protein